MIHLGSLGCAWGEGGTCAYSCTCVEACFAPGELGRAEKLTGGLGGEKVRLETRV